MRKTLFLIPLLTLASIGLNGCTQDKRARLTYGTLVDTEAEEIVYGTLSSKVARGENLLISVYQDGLPCGCWSTFHDVLDQYAVIVPQTEAVQRQDRLGVVIPGSHQRSGLPFLRVLRHQCLTHLDVLHGIVSRCEEIHL